MSTTGSRILVVGACSISNAPGSEAGRHNRDQKRSTGEWLFVASAAVILLYLFSLTAQISEGIERAVNSPEFQTQLAVIGVFYLIASWLVTAWSHFESLVHELNAMEQVSAASLKWLDDAIALFLA